AKLVDDAVMAVGRVGVESDVRAYSDLRHRILNRADRAADQVVAVERFLRALGPKLVGRVGEERDARDSEIRRLFRLRGDPVDAPSANARKRADGLLAIAPFSQQG